MNSDSTAPDNDPNLSGIGRALLETGGSKPSGPWVPPTAEELHAILPQYEIVKMLGRGGMGAVYMGRQTSLERPVAIKILSAHLEESDRGFTERFKNEAKAMAKLNHPGIVSVYDFGEAPGGLLYIVMEYVDGTDVAKMIAAKGRLHTEHAMAITAHVCDALAYAHERGIIHRDIKPANIMVGYDGEVKVADFGLAKVNSGGSTLGLTMSGMAMGTLHFMAPEALMLGTAVDHRADIYAVGVMLYQMLTGKLPQGMFKMPSLLVAGLDPRYDGIIAKGIMEDREARYQNVREMRADLDSILTQPVIKVETPPPASSVPAAVLPTQARPQRPGGRPPQPPRSTPQPLPQRSMAWLWMLILVLAAGGVWIFMSREKPAAENPAATAPVSEETKLAVTTPSQKSGSPTDTSISSPVAFTAAELVGLWTQTVPAVSGPPYEVQVLANQKAIFTSDKQVNGTWNLAGGRASFVWENGSRYELIPLSAAVLEGSRTDKNGTSAALRIERKTLSKSDAVPSAAESKSPREDWTNLFNGNDLSGWELQPSNFPADVQDGMIRIRGSSTIPVSGNMYYRGAGSAMPQWTDFELICTVKTENKGNSGIFLHSSPGMPDKNRANGVEVQIWNDLSTGSTGKSGSLQRVAVTNTARFGDGEWFQVKTRVEGMRVQTWLKKPSETDWQPAVDWTQPSTWSAPYDRPGIKLGSGTISLQNNPPIDGVAWFKEILFRDLTQVTASDPIATTPPGTLVETFNGHRYQFIPGSFTWQEAKAKAESMGGHLATLTTKEENEWLLLTYRGLLTTLNRNIWLGASESAPNAGWKWVTGEPFAPLGWFPGEPNGVNGGGGSVGHPFMLNLYSFRDNGVGWNDSSTHESQSRNNIGFIVEWESLRTTSPSDVKSTTLGSATTSSALESHNEVTNSLGMKFVPVPITGGPTGGKRVLFSIWETRVGDYDAFITDTGRKWNRPSFAQDDRHPAVNINWFEAQDFCAWLTETERKAGKIGPQDRYRLPSDHEWSCAAGIGEKENPTAIPQSKDLKTKGYPWDETGTVWPPPAGFGNYAGSECLPHGDKAIQNYKDGYPFTAPTGSFPPNQFGLFDLAGNVWEWCEDLLNQKLTNRVYRGGSFWWDANHVLTTGARNNMEPEGRSNGVGFRLVLELAQPAAAVPTNASTSLLTAKPSSTLASATTWIDTKGRSLQAKFVRVEGANVVLDIAGNNTPVLLSTLSDTSQQIAHQLQLTQPQVTPPSDWLVGQWHQTNDGKSFPVHLLEFKADHTASFAGGSLRTTGQWTFNNEIVSVDWANGARYRIDVPANKPSEDLSGMIFDIDGHTGAKTKVRMQKTGAKSDSGWVPLFPSDSLSGWTGDLATGRVANGILTSSGGRGSLISPKEYGNFHLKFDLRVGAGANNGIGIWRAPLGGSTLDAPRGFEIQVLDDTAEEFKAVESWQRHGGIYYFKAPLSLVMGPVGSWNTHEIRVEGTQVKVTINGKLVQDADVTKLLPQTPRAPSLDVSRKRGHLIILGNKGVTEFRNMQIKELP